MLNKKIDGRKKEKTDPSNEFIKLICSLYDDYYDDRIEDSKPKGVDWRPGECANHLSLQAFQKILSEEYGIVCSTAKIRKILITGGLWSTKRSREIQKKYRELKSIKLVAQKLGLTMAAVSINMPYEKVVYDLDNKSGNAKRIERWRALRHN